MAGEGEITKATNVERERNHSDLQIKTYKSEYDENNGSGVYATRMMATKKQLVTEMS